MTCHSSVYFKTKLTTLGVVGIFVSPNIKSSLNRTRQHSEMRLDIGSKPTGPDVRAYSNLMMMMMMIMMMILQLSSPLMVLFEDN